MQAGSAGRKPSVQWYANDNVFVRTNPYKKWSAPINQTQTVHNRTNKSFFLVFNFRQEKYQRPPALRSPQHTPVFQAYSISCKACNLPCSLYFFVYKISLQFTKLFSNKQIKFAKNGKDFLKFFWEGLQ